MAFSAHPLQHLRLPHARRPVLLWALALLVLLKAFVPLLAAEAAHARNVPIADICGVYGVEVSLRTPAGPDPWEPAGHPSPAAQEHCALAPLLGSATVVPAVAVVVPLPVPPHYMAAHLVAAFAPPDPWLAWLVERLHAPPSRV
ncbi:DUF2946 family protein [Caldimonas brevitalea]|uniref:DUF2946 family protein n=1 Tax=Caldimonas brevitalea TaxID=413882 RepID=UPI0012F85BF4|nr:DUF2946 family protein [Caldimonas brevitalea]